MSGAQEIEAPQPKSASRRSYCRREGLSDRLKFSGKTLKRATHAARNVDGVQRVVRVFEVMSEEELKRLALEPAVQPSNGTPPPGTGQHRGGKPKPFGPKVLAPLLADAQFSGKPN